MPPDLPSLALPLRGSLFCITIQEKNFRGPLKDDIGRGPALPSFGPAAGCREKRVEIVSGVRKKESRNFGGGMDLKERKDFGGGM